jgi:zinc protease
VAASGDTSGLKIAERMNRLIADLPSAGKSQPIEPTDPAESADLLSILRERVAPLRGRILLVDTPAAQAVIAIGGYLPARNHPDLYALQTGNYILGGGSFNSRLTREIRVRRGLAYYAYSYNDFDGTLGRFLAGSGTRSLLAHRTLKLMLETIAGMRSDISGQELSLAQDAILNGLAFQFDSPEDAVLHAFRNRLHGMPADYLERFPERIRAMSAADLSAAARRYLDPDELYIVVAGPAGIKEKLEEIRPVIVIKPEDLIRDIRVAKR